MFYLCVSAASVVVVPHRRHEGLFMANGQLCTKNMFPGEYVYDEMLFPVQVSILAPLFF